MALSPMMRHYLETKEQYPDCILMYRLGDFYEMFFDDAKLVSKELELTLTGRDCGLEKRAPMCGVPFHAVDGYIAKLVERGYKVAICEQMTPPGKGALVDRDVVRVVTAGTITEAEMLDEKSNNYIAACFYADRTVGLAWCDLSTGEFNFNQFDENPLDRLSDALVRIAPAEIICNEPMLEPSTTLSCVKSLSVPKFGVYRIDAWEYGAAEASVGDLLGTEGKDKKYAVCAAGALMRYMADMQKKSVGNVSRIELEDESEYMYLDASTRRNLELTATIRDTKGKKGTLLWLLDKTCTAMGKRLLRRWVESPLYRVETIRARQDCVEELTKDSVLLGNLRDDLKPLFDIERLSGKVAYRSVTPRDMAAIRNTLGALPELKLRLKECRAAGLRELEEQINPLDDLYATLAAALIDEPPHLSRDGGFVREGYCEELDTARALGTDATQWLAALEASEKESTGIKNLRIGYNRVFGYYIEVTKSQIESVPYRYQRKQTTVNAERYVTQELKELEEKILNGKERALELELRIFEELIEKLNAEVARLQRTAKAIAQTDCYASLALVACEYDYVRPEIADDGVIEIVDGRHPTIERMGGDLFVPNNTMLDGGENRIMVITGPNMAGKSTYMRQVALIVIMAHIGSFVPAKRAHVTLTDRVFTRIGASDDLLTGHSTFMVEMLEVADILDHATEKSLLLLDEIGRGTSTYDGLSIAWAVTEYLSSKLRAKSLFSTHYHELTELEKRLDGVKNYRITVKELGNTIVFLHKIARGSATRSFGIEVASIAGINDEVVARAKEILKNLQDNDINNGVANKVSPSTQANMFDAVSLKGYYEIKDILKEIDFDRTTPIQALEILSDLAERVKD